MPWHWPAGACHTGVKTLSSAGGWPSCEGPSSPLTTCCTQLGSPQAPVSHCRAACGPAGRSGSPGTQCLCCDLMHSQEPTPDSSPSPLAPQPPSSVRSRGVSVGVRRATPELTGGPALGRISRVRPSQSFCMSAQNSQRSQQPGLGQASHAGASRSALAGNWVGSASAGLTGRGLATACPTEPLPRPRQAHFQQGFGLQCASGRRRPMTPGADHVDMSSHLPVSQGAGTHQVPIMAHAGSCVLRSVGIQLWCRLNVTLDATSIPH